MDTLDTSAMDGILGYRLRRAQLAVFQVFQPAFDATGLRPAEYSTLALVRDNPGRKQAEIAEALGIKRANFVALADGLAKRALMERRVRDGDRRANALFLTDAGLALTVAFETVQAEIERELVGQLGGQRARARLMSLLGKLIAPLPGR